MRFSVLARFDDGVIGDITNWSPFQDLPAGATHLRHRQGGRRCRRWAGRSATPARRSRVDPVTGVLDVRCGGRGRRRSRSSGGHSPHPRRPARQTSDRCVGAPAWTTPVKPDPRARARASRAWRHVRATSCSCPTGSSTAPRQAVQPAGAAARQPPRPTARRRRPFDLPLAMRRRSTTSWRWVPSPDAGVTVLNELYRTNIGRQPGEGSDGAPRAAAARSPARGPRGAAQRGRAARRRSTIRSAARSAPRPRAACRTGASCTATIITARPGRACAIRDWLRPQRPRAAERAGHRLPSGHQRPAAARREAEPSAPGLFNVLRLTHATTSTVFLGALADDKGSAVG